MAVCKDPRNRATYIQIEKRLAAAVAELAAANAAEAEFFGKLATFGVCDLSDDSPKGINQSA